MDCPRCGEYEPPAGQRVSVLPWRLRCEECKWRVGYLVINGKLLVQCVGEACAKP